jgi:molybdate transport system regulatory protein
MIKPACKIWLCSKDGKAFGQGPYELLRHVEKTRSLAQAAKEMRMSYNKAWKLIQQMEAHLGFPLLDRRVGGTAGGGSQVTRRAKDFLDRYERFEADTMKAVERAYQTYFKKGA